MHKDKGEERATFTVGFCMGGTISFLTAATDIGLNGAIGFYAPPISMFEGAFLDRVEQIKRPVLGLFGDADHVISVSDAQAFDERLDRAGVEHEIIIYPGAPHGFFELQIVEYADDAWRRVLGFIDAHTSRT